MDANTAITQLASIAQEARLSIFRLLVQAGKHGLPAGKIAEALAIPTSTLSFHLKELSRAGLIDANPDGRFIYYSASYQTMDELIAYLTENCCAGETEQSICETNKTCC